jgi:myosin heavy subunit
MSTQINPTTPVRPTQNNSKNIIIGLLAAGLLGTGGYLAYDKTQSSEKLQKQETQLVQVTDEKSEIQQSFDESLSRLDSMTGLNSSLQEKLSVSTEEIAKAKAEIRSILKKRNATTAELSRAKQLIAKLNGSIQTMQEDIARLTNENQTLGQEKVALTAERDVLTTEKQQLSTDLASTTTAKVELEKKVDVASTLNASNIAITPIQVRSNGKEKVSDKAKRVDKLIISFDVVNRIAEPGQADVYVVVIGPDGKPVSTSASVASTFTTRDEGDKPFTAKLPVDIETAKRKNVEFALTQPTSFKEGSYRIQIYQNGFLIGDGTRQLKKSGLFG